MSGVDEHVEHCRLVAVGLDLDSMMAAVHAELLEGAVEAVDDANEVAVDVDLRVPRLDLQANGAFRFCRGSRILRTGRVRRVIAGEPPAP